MSNRKCIRVQRVIVYSDANILRTNPRKQFRTLEHF